MIKRIYDRRFGNENTIRMEMWRTLYKMFFKKYIPEDSVILDIGAGRCEFINVVVAKERWAIDKNPAIGDWAHCDVRIIDLIEEMPDNYLDVVFISNLFEHLEKIEISKMLGEIRRTLKPGGSLLVLYPNIKYCYKDYWMFFDHITPLDDSSMAEVIEVSGFEVVENRKRFLPFTTKSRLPKSIFLLKIYLMFPTLHRIFGGQGFIRAKKI